MRALQSEMVSFESDSLSSVGHRCESRQLSGCCYKLMMNKINHPSKYIKSKYKVALLGPYACGKSALLARVALGAFEQNYHMTLRPSSYNKVIRLEDSLLVRLELIDTLGSGIHSSQVHASLRDIDALLLLYDLTNEQSFFKLADMIAELKRQLPKDTLLALVGTHCDQPHLREVTPQEANQLKKQHAISLFYEVSARTNENVSELFHDLAKYLVIVGASREKEENPEASTTYEEERMGAGRTAKTAVLEKKLAYKEEECLKLWKDYEDAMERIAVLEARAKQDSSYILNYAGDTEEYQLRVQQLEEELESVRNEKTVLQEQHRAILRNELNRADDLESENERLKLDLQKHSKELADIETIIQQHEQNSKELLEQKRNEIEQLKAERCALQDENRTLTQLLQEQISNKTQLKLELQQRVATLITQLAEREEQLATLQKQKEKLLFLKQQSDRLLQDYQLKVTQYRQQIVEMHYLQDELAIQHQKYYTMEITYEESMAKMKRSYEAEIKTLQQEKELILEEKDKLVSKVISNKVDQIKLIRSFIGEIDSKKEGNASMVPAAQRSEADDKVRQFFGQFLQLIQENSQYLHYNLQTLLESYQTAESQCSELLEETSRLDLSEVWYDLKEREENSYLASLIQKPEAHQIWCILNLQTHKRVAKCVAVLEGIIERVGEANGDLKTNLSHISQSLDKVGKIRQVGLEAYVQTLQS